jgi:hypothetical protein
MLFVSLAMMPAKESEVFGYDSLTDTVQKSAIIKSSRIRITTRIHSLGVFNYAGMIANENPSMDLILNYERKSWGYLIVKAADLYDIHSPYNFTLAVGYLNLRIGDCITIRPYAGVVLDQMEKIAGHGSDGICIITTTFRINKQFSVEHCARLSNVLVETEAFDWLNRFRLIYNKDHVEVMLSCWNNNKVFDDNQYTSGALNISYARIKVSERMHLTTGITALKMLDLNENEMDDRSGIVFTIAATMN